MQSRKVSNSKKTNKNANEAAVNEKNASEVTTKPRVSRSKKETSPETSSVNNYQKSAVGAANIPASESSLVAKTLPENTDAPKVMSAAVGLQSAPFEAAVIDPVGVVAAPENGILSHFSRDEVAKLAYSYWIARGHSHGLADEDWLRAEVELAGRR